MPTKVDHWHVMWGGKVGGNHDGMLPFPGVSLGGALLFASQLLREGKAVEIVGMAAGDCDACIDDPLRSIACFEDGHSDCTWRDCACPCHTVNPDEVRDYVSTGGT